MAVARSNESKVSNFARSFSNICLVAVNLSNLVIVSVTAGIAITQSIGCLVL